MTLRKAILSVVIIHITVVPALAQGEPLTGRRRRMSVMMASAGSAAPIVPFYHLHAGQQP
jgi:hypothetical protein